MKRKPHLLRPPYTPARLRSIAAQIASGRGTATAEQVRAVAEGYLEFRQLAEDDLGAGALLHIHTLH